MGGDCDGGMIFEPFVYVAENGLAEMIKYPYNLIKGKCKHPNKKIPIEYTNNHNDKVIRNDVELICFDQNFSGSVLIVLYCLNLTEMD